MIAEIVAAAIGTVAFALLFAVPKEHYINCGLIGGAGYGLYYVLVHFAGSSAAVATFFATVLVIVLSRVAAVWKRCPATVFLIAGIFPLVPGAGVYWTTYYVVTGQAQQAADSGFAAVKAAVAIVLGIVVVFELPYRFFSWMPRSRSGKKMAHRRENH